jgi:adenine-specific DNA-methyltransferase
MAARRKQHTDNEWPVLHWPDKKAPAAVTPGKAQLCELFAPDWATAVTTHGPDAAQSEPNALYFGDNRDVLAHLLDRGLGGKVKLVYIDPPFDTGSVHRRKVRLRAPKAPTMQTAADAVVGAQTQYHDRWRDGAYLQFIYERLPLIRELLAEDGTLWLHCDHRQAHHLRVLLQEVFGGDNYLNTVIWRSQVARGAKVKAFYFPFSAHYLEIFARNRRAAPTWHPPKKQIVLNESEAARAYFRDERGFFRTSDPGTYSFASLKTLHNEGRLYAPYSGEVVVDETAGRIYASNGGNLGVKYYLTDLGRGSWAVERAVDNLWDDIPGLGTTPGEDLGYPTQKTEALLERIIRTATDPGDLVLDCFMGSGTTLAVAQRLGRRWIGCDSNYGAIQTTRRRLHALALAVPAAASFALYRTENTPLPAPGPLQAQLRIARLADHPTTITVTIDTVHSPELAALVEQSPRAAALAAGNWRTLVDCVAIDPAYDGQLFRSSIVDAPQKKSDQVIGHYSFLVSAAPITVAVRICDLLGQEAVFTALV